MKSIVFAGKIFTEKNIIKNGAVLVENDIIKKVYKSRENLKPDYDFSNFNLYPGLIDIHIHGGYGYDIMNGKDDISALAKNKLKEGVTAFSPTLITSDLSDIRKLLDILKDIKNNPSKNSSDILNCFLEGPYISKEFRGVHEEKYIRELDFEETDNILNKYSDLISRIAIAPEKKNALSIIKLLKKYNIKAALGHSGADSFQTESAIDAGADTAIHTFNAMKGFNHRNGSILGTVLTDDRIYCEIIADLIHTDLTALKLLLKCKPMNKIILVSDCLSAGGLSDGEYTLGNTKIFVKNGIARNENKTLAGSTLKLTNGIKNMISAGADFVCAVNMASINPAAAIGIDTFMGSIKAGKKADFFIGDDEINVKYVFKNGCLV